MTSVTRQKRQCDPASEELWSGHCNFVKLIKELFGTRRSWWDVLALSYRAWCMRYDTFIGSSQWWYIKGSRKKDNGREFTRDNISELNTKYLLEEHREEAKKNTLHKTIPSVSKTVQKDCTQSWVKNFLVDCITWSFN